MLVLLVVILILASVGIYFASQSVRRQSHHHVTPNQPRSHSNSSVTAIPQALQTQNPPSPSPTAIVVEGSPAGSNDSSSVKKPGFLARLFGKRQKQPRHQRVVVDMGLNNTLPQGLPNLPLLDLSPVAVPVFDIQKDDSQKTPVCDNRAASTKPSLITIPPPPPVRSQPSLVKDFLVNIGKNNAIESGLELVKLFPHMGFAHVRGRIEQYPGAIPNVTSLIKLPEPKPDDHARELIGQESDSCPDDYKAPFSECLREMGVVPRAISSPSLALIRPIDAPLFPAIINGTVAPCCDLPQVIILGSAGSDEAHVDVCMSKDLTKSAHLKSKNRDAATHLAGLIGLKWAPLLSPTNTEPMRPAVGTLSFLENFGPHWHSAVFKWTNLVDAFEQLLERTENVSSSPLVIALTRMADLIPPLSSTTQLELFELCKRVLALRETWSIVVSKGTFMNTAHHPRLVICTDAIAPVSSITGPIYSTLAYAEEFKWAHRNRYGSIDDRSNIMCVCVAGLLGREDSIQKRLVRIEEWQGKRQDKILASERAFRQL